MTKLKIKVKNPWIAYSGSTLQQNYAESLDHGYLHWKIPALGEGPHSVEYCQLPNPKPFVTIDWTGNVSSTINVAKSYPRGSRFRIKSTVHITQQDVHALTTQLKSDCSATEVTFKADHVISKDQLTNTAFSIGHADIRNPDVILGLIKSFHSATKCKDDTWEKVSEYVKYYLNTVSASEENFLRNSKWRLRNLKFDNLFSYGEGNELDFDKMNGIIGIFGSNRIGKSSIVGSVMYSLFNSTDRGSVKNLHVCNIRKPFCYSRAIVNVSGCDYIFERQTTKYENKKGVSHAPTALNVFKMEGGEAIDLAGEQRNDTEKVIRGLIGTADDFLLTSLSAQGEINQFIDHGSSRRRQILSRFLDLDIFDRMYDYAARDFNAVKSQLKVYPDKDWNAVATTFRNRITEIDLEIEHISHQAQEKALLLAEVRSALAKHSNFTPVSESQVDQHKKKVAALETEFISVSSIVQTLRASIASSEEKSAKISLLKEENDLTELKKKLATLTSLESDVSNLKHIADRDATLLKQQQRSLKILDEVPCGDKFPKCKFIKDAHDLKPKIDPQKEKLSRSIEKLEKASAELNLMMQEDLVSKVEKLQQLHDLHAKLLLESEKQKVDLVKNESAVTVLESNLAVAKARLVELERALNNRENEEVVSLRAKVEDYSKAASMFDKRKLDLASERGKIISDAEKALEEKKTKEQLLDKMKVYEMITTAFSKKGIPSVISTSQLPLINAEIHKILAGIVDFTIELEVDEESDSMDVYINYGDSKRVIELASGMEKMVGSIAIRVALINISSLPKTDMFIIDEGFGALDDSTVEACNRLLISLKHHFKTILVITHVDGVKDAADTILEISKVEKDSRVVYT